MGAQQSFAPPDTNAEPHGLVTGSPMLHRQRSHSDNFAARERNLSVPKGARLPSTDSTRSRFASVHSLSSATTDTDAGQPHAVAYTSFRTVKAIGPVPCEPISSDRWVPDLVRQDCHGCSKEFTFFRRRHHCRACGEVFCSDCSKFDLPVSSAFGGGTHARMDSNDSTNSAVTVVATVNSAKLVRVCSSCYAVHLEMANGSAFVDAYRKQNPSVNAFQTPGSASAADALQVKKEVKHSRKASSRAIDGAAGGQSIANKRNAGAQPAGSQPKEKQHSFENRVPVPSGAIPIRAVRSPSLGDRSTGSPISSALVRSSTSAFSHVTPNASREATPVKQHL